MYEKSVILSEAQDLLLTPPHTILATALVVSPRQAAWFWLQVAARVPTSRL